MKRALIGLGLLVLSSTSSFSILEKEYGCIQQSGYEKQENVLDKGRPFKYSAYGFSKMSTRYEILELGSNSRAKEYFDLIVDEIDSKDYIKVLNFKHGSTTDGRYISYYNEKKGVVMATIQAYDKIHELLIFEKEIPEINLENFEKYLDVNIEAGWVIEQALLDKHEGVK